ncbi:MAG: membrane protein insertion efficiency factor YidD [Gemmatimonadetes bacterium]|nr:membrane protein insertion efficiency factor YidD [Gemmatimonadota bacterium]
MLTKTLLGLIRFYQRAVSPLTPAACRFTPTCSAYAEEAIDEYGPARGSWLALRRLLRCHPFGGAGCDPVPGRRELQDETEAPRGASDATRTSH